ncbi:MAG: RidA family protein [Deltaproteobacteria bacterium]|nr:RidA family protein [Deltaproteobacteria bacterium]
MTKKAIVTKAAPDAIGPYSQGVEAGPGRLFFISGQLPVDPRTGELAGDSPVEQAARSLENIRAILEKAGLGMHNVVKTTIFLSDLAFFRDVNQVYSGFFEEPFPARATVQVAALPMGAGVEIECIAIG